MSQTFLKNLLIFSLTCAIASASSTTSNTLTTGTLTTAIDNAATYLTKTLEPNGMFEYRINMDPKVPVEPRYNMLRHAGTIYSLSMYHSFKETPEVLDTLTGSGRYLIDDSLGPVNNNEQVLAVWSKPEVNRIGAPLQAKLGGAGLGLVALNALKDIQDEFVTTEQLQGLGNFIVNMQQENGNFYSKFIPSQGGKQDNWISLYYPGEAALGLVKMWERDRKEIWLRAAVRALGYLAMSRKDDETVPADHWALLATAQLFKLTDEAKIKIPRALLERHALQICSVMVQTQEIDSKNPIYLGGYTPDGRTTPTATRLEGLLATLEWLPEEHPAHRVILASAESGIEFLLRSQIKEGPYKGGFPRAIARIKGNSPETMDFNIRAFEIRIDYVQHAMSALIQYYELSQARQ